MVTESPVKVPSESAFVSPSILVLSYSAATDSPMDPARLKAVEEAVLLENASTLIAPALLREPDPMSASVLASLVTSASAATAAMPANPPTASALSSESATFALDAEIVRPAACTTLPSSCTSVAPATIELGIATAIAPRRPPEARNERVLARLFEIAGNSTKPPVADMDDVGPRRRPAAAGARVSGALTTP